MVQLHQPGSLPTCITQGMEIRKLLFTLNAARMVDLCQRILHQAHDQEQYGNNNRKKWSDREPFTKTSKKSNRAIVSTEPLRSASKCLGSMEQSNIVKVNPDRPRCNKKGRGTKPEMKNLYLQQEAHERVRFRQWSQEQAKSPKMRPVFPGAPRARV